MSDKPCNVCAVSDPALRNAIEANLAGEGGIPAAIVTAAAKGVSLTKYGLQKHRSEKHSPAPKKAAAAPVATGPYLNTNAEVKVSENGEGTISTGETFDNNADWDTLLANFGINPDKVIVKGDTIRMSARTVRYFDENGDEQSRVARSFSAAFMPRPSNWIEDDYLDELGRELRSRGTKPIKTTHGNSTYLVCLADLQLGKSEGGGIKATLERFNHAMDGVIDNFHTLVKQGVKFEGIALAQMGDLLEGCIGNYDSQTFTVEANQRRQLNIGLDVMVATIDRLLEETRLPIHVIGVNSNHGSWMRRGGKSNITSTSDTSDGAVQDALMKVFRHQPLVTFTELNDEAVVTATLSGVNVGFSHGHLTSQARADQWLDDQDRVLSRLENFPVDIFVTAHSHHFRQQDLGAYQWFQCPALDGGSKWFQDVRGRWSTAGILTMVLSDSLPTKVDSVRCQWAALPVPADL